MNLVDILLTVGILLAAGWIFYKSFIVKKGSCAGCTGSACGKEGNGKDQLVSLLCKDQTYYKIKQ